MNLQELSQNEMTEINGGGLLDNLGLGSLLNLGGSSGTNQGGLGGIVGLGSLLSLSNTSADGTSTEVSVGKGLSLNLSGLFNSF